MNTNTQVSSLRIAARTAGILYLFIIAGGIFAEMFVRSSLIVTGDATATANNIIAAQGLFRLGIMGDIVMIVSDIAIALAFFVLLKPVNNTLSLLAAFFRLAQAIILGINLINLFYALQLLSGADYLTVLGIDELHSQALFFLNAHATGYRIGLVFFGFSILIVGYLIVKSGYIPKVLGVLLVIAALAYLFDSFAEFLMPNYADYEELFTMIVFTPAFISELALALWLLIRGVGNPTSESIAPVQQSATA